MKKSRIMSALVAAGFACASAVGAVKPEVRLIDISAPSGWMLSILPDGSGSIGYGSLPFDQAGFPAGTFEFDTISAQLTELVMSREVSEAHYSVAFVHAGETSTICQKLLDQPLALRLFTQALDAADLSGTRLEELYATQPPVLSGEEKTHGIQACIRGPIQFYTIRMSQPEGDSEIVGSLKNLSDETVAFKGAFGTPRMMLIGQPGEQARYVWCHHRPDSREWIIKPHEEVVVFRESLWKLLNPDMEVCAWAIYTGCPWSPHFVGWMTRLPQPPVAGFATFHFIVCLDGNGPWEATRQAVSREILVRFRR